MHLLFIVIYYNIKSTCISRCFLISMRLDLHFRYPLRYYTICKSNKNYTSNALRLTS